LRDHHNAKLLGGTQHFSDTQIVGPSGSYDRLPAIRDTGRFLEKIQDFGYTPESTGTSIQIFWRFWNHYSQHMAAENPGDLSKLTRKNVLSLFAGIA
jgi:hypothetical protein